MAKVRKPIGIKCEDSDCDQGLHCFRATKEMRGTELEGSCRACGARLVDWQTVHRRSIQDVDLTFASLQNEFIRHHFWHKEFHIRAVNYARRKGKVKLLEAVTKRLRTCIAPAQPFHDGWQTPMNSDSPNPIYNAQHATATCCRRCLEYWHGVPMGRELSSEELEYFANLVFQYLDFRFPSLSEEGERIAPLRGERRD